MDLILVWFAVILVKNLFQDLVWLARGEDPPSFRREQERRRLRAARGGPVTDRHEARQYWANAWHDAWETAGERRQRRHEQRQEDRRERWAREDEEHRRPDDAELTGPKGAGSDVAPMDVVDPLKPVSGPVPGLTPATVKAIKQRIVAEYAADNVEEDEVIVKPNGDIVIDRRRKSPWAKPLTVGKWTPSTPTAPNGSPGMPGETQPAGPPPDEPPGPPPIAPEPAAGAVKEHEANYQRYAMRRRNSGSAPTAQQLAGDLGIGLADAEDQLERWDQRYQRDAAGDEATATPSGAAEQADTPEPPEEWGVGYRSVEELRREIAADEADRRIREKSLAEWREYLALPDEEKQRLRDEVRARLAGTPLEDSDPDPDPRSRFASAFNAALASKAEGDLDRAEEQLMVAERAAAELGITTEEEMREVLNSQASEQTTPGSTPALTHPAPDMHTSNGTENGMTASGETTGLGSALTYTSSMAQSAGEGAASVETSIASLQAGEVSGEALAQLAQAQEYLTQAQAAFNAANATLTQHQNVQESYAATPDAGNKQFMQND